MNNKHKRLYIFTGKGGVGKTTLSLAMAKSLKDEGHEVYYNSFLTTPDAELCKKLGIKLLDYDLLSSAEMYVARKLKSETIASWIMKTTFFKSLFQMIPGLGHMILLGHLIDELEKYPHLTIIMDSPASGHALTMFESTSNFKKIFSAGLIVKDIERMHTFLSNKDNLKTYVVALPTELAMHEALDLKNNLAQNIQGLSLNPEIIINDSLFEFLTLNQVNPNELPLFLQDKLKREDDIPNETKRFSHIAEIDDVAIITKLSSQIGKLE